MIHGAMFWCVADRNWVRHEDAPLFIYYPKISRLWNMPISQRQTVRLEKKESDLPPQTFEGPQIFEGVYISSAQHVNVKATECVFFTFRLVSSSHLSPSACTYAAVRANPGEPSAVKSRVNPRRSERLKGLLRSLAPHVFNAANPSLEEASRV